MMDDTSPNLALWSRHADVDPAFTKKITGKPYQGTSPSPQYVIKCLTDMFGPVGKGFGWDVLADGFQPLGEEVLHWCRIRFWHGDRSQHFEAYGQTKAVLRTKNGPMADEDAPKKSLTDAIVKAASQIGVAANIFLGRWDDARYVAQVKDDFQQDASRNEQEAAISAIASANTLADLKATWAQLYANVRHVTEAPDVIAAKDAKKAKLTAHQEPPF